MNCECNSNEIKLAGEYKCLLSSIGPLIDQLDKPKDAQLCLLWLTKLVQAPESEGHYRNELLTELSRQIKNKCLEPPFNTQPPPGPLKNINVKDSIPLWRSNDFSDDISSDITSSRSPFSSRSPSKEPSRPRPYQRRMNFSSGGSDCSETLKEDHSKCLAIREKYRERLLNDQVLITRYQEVIRSLITQNFKSSGPVKAKSMRSCYENKINELKSSLKIAEEENHNLRQKMSAGVVPCEKFHQVVAVNEELKEKLERLEVMKSALQIKCDTLEREKDEMGERLKDCEKSFRETESYLMAVEKKYEENFRASKTEHHNEINELEKKYTCELSTLERMLEDKQNEIGNLKEQVSTQGLHFESEVLRLKHDLLQNPDLEKEKRKVKFLKNKLKNMEKLQENMASAFQSQFEQLIAKKDLLISTLEMKLKCKDSDYDGNGWRYGLDNVINEKVCVLEAQYRKLLEESENQAIQRRQMDLQKIQILEKQLVDHGVGVQDLSLVNYQVNLSLIGSNQNEDLIKCKEEK